MIFCGQCGLQLAPGSTRCPRCGTVVEAPDTATNGDSHVDDATVASRAFPVQNQTPPPTPNSQQPLILRGNSDYGYGTQDAGGATSRVEQVNYNTQVPPVQQQAMGNSYAGYPLQQSGGYPPVPGGYPVQNTGGYPPQISQPGYPLNAQPGTPYTEPPVQMSGGYPPYSGQYPLNQRASSAKGRTTGLVLVLIGLLLILSAAFLFAVQQGLISGIKLGATEPTRSVAIAAISTYRYSGDAQYVIYTNQEFRSHISTTARPA